VIAAAKADLKIVRYFLAAAFLVPCLLYLVVVVGGVPIGGSGWTWMLLVPWATFALIMSAEAGGGSAGEAIAFLISAAANVAVYGLVGVAFRFVYRRYPSRPS
jgi:hypothetical protein